MKKLIVLAALLIWPPFVFAHDVWISTNTATVDTTKFMCGKNTFAFKARRGFVHNVCVNTGAAGTFTIYNSSASAINPLAAIDTTAKGCTEYDVQLSSGLTYTNSATANVTMTYSCQ